MRSEERKVAVFLEGLDVVMRACLRPLLAAAVAALPGDHATKFATLSFLSLTHTLSTTRSLDGQVEERRDDASGR